jgi:hypothetical protein
MLGRTRCPTRRRGGLWWARLRRRWLLSAFAAEGGFGEIAP